MGEPNLLNRVDVPKIRISNIRIFPIATPLWAGALS